MFKRTRFKIMIFITLSVMLLLAGTAGAISLSSYIEQYNQTLGPRQDTDSGRGEDLPYGQTEQISQEEMEVQLSIIKQFVHVMIRNTIRVGIVIVIIVFILSYFIAGWILKPLEQSYKKQKQFISDAGHELKTPVAAIDANAELLHADIGDNKWLENIRYESGRMTELVRQLLDLARAESVQLQKENLDMSRLVMGSVLAYEGIAFEKGYVIETDIDNDIFVMGNRGQLEQLTEILVDNAIYHAIGEGPIRVSLKKEGMRIALNVSNPGPAIADEDMKNLFERFYRADKGRSDNGHYGLGLVIAKAIVTAHKGEIGIVNSNGRNSFFILL